MPWRIVVVNLDYTWSFKILYFSCSMQVWWMRMRSITWHPVILFRNIWDSTLNPTIIPKQCNSLLESQTPLKMGKSEFSFWQMWALKIFLIHLENICFCNFLITASNNFVKTFWMTWILLSVIIFTSSNISSVLN